MSSRERWGERGQGECKGEDRDFPNLIFENCMRLTGGGARGTRVEF